MTVASTFSVRVMIVAIIRKSIAPVANSAITAGKLSRSARAYRICPDARARLMFCAADTSADLLERIGTPEDALGQIFGATRIQLPHRYQPLRDGRRLRPRRHTHGVYRGHVGHAFEHVFDSAKLHRHRPGSNTPPVDRSRSVDK